MSEEFITKAQAERGRWFDAGRPLAQALLRTRAKRVLVDGPLGLPMRHTVNPALYLPDLQTRTRFGKDYLGRLDDLTGVRRERLRDGRWVQAEGVVYEEWDAAVHLADAIDIPPHWRRYWAIDFGFTNPLSWQFWAEDPDGRLHLHREIYQPGLLVADACSWVRKLTEGEPSPEAIITDHDPEAMAVVERSLGVRCTPAEKTDRD